MEYKSLARELETIFRRRQWKWKVDGELIVPTRDDILETLELMHARLADEPSGTWLELGHMILIKTNGLMDVYMHHGTVERQDEQPNTESPSETP